MMGNMKAALARSRVAAITAAALLLAATGAWAQTSGGGTEGFVPVNTLPPAQLLPAAPLLVAAYAFVWLALLVFLWTIWRRLGKVEGELRQLEGKTK